MEQNQDETLSFLESISEIEVKNISQSVLTKPKISSDIIDPVFVNLEVRIPKKIEKIFKSVSEIRYLYSIVDQDYIEMYDTYENRSLIKVFVANFEDFTFSATPSSHINFIFNKDRYKRSVNQEIRKKYKESLQKNTQFDEFNHYNCLKDKYLTYQIQQHVNFVFINDGTFFHIQIKNLISILRSKDCFVPKAKKSDDKSEYIVNFLSSVPGVSTNVAKHIAAKYNSFESIAAALENRSEFCKLQIYDESGKTSRFLPEKIFERLYKIFLSKKPNEKI